MLTCVIWNAIRCPWSPDRSACRRMAPKTWDERQIRYMNIGMSSMIEAMLEIWLKGCALPARPKPGGSLEDRRKATASLPAPKLAPGVGLRKIRIPRLPLKGFEESASGDFEAFIFDPPGTHSGFDLPTLLFCHGGGYTNMSPTTHQGVASNFAAQGVRVVSIDYRLSPEHPFPAALTDAVSAYKHLLLNDGVSEEKIFFGGDSAGGGLALTLALWVRDHGSDEDIPQCAGLVLVSPYVDLTHSTPTGYLDDEFAFDTLLKMEPNVPE